MSETTVHNSMGSVSVASNDDGSLGLLITSHADGPTLIDLTREYAAEIGRALTGTPAPFLENARLEDIRKGDLVRTERTEVAVKVTREGIAHSKGPADWCTEGCEWLGCEDAQDGGTITILSRPTPQLPAGDGEMILSGNVFYLWDGPLGWKSLAGDGHVSHDDMARRDWKLAKVVEA